MPTEHVVAVAHCHCCNLWRVLGHLAIDGVTFCACVNITPVEAGQGVVCFSMSFGGRRSWNSQGTQIRI